MALRNILHVKEDLSRLREHAKPVTEFDAHLWELLDDLKETMKVSDGCGLAAVQVGVLRRVAVVDVGDENGLTELINPVIKKASGTAVEMEGCLSVPGEHGYVSRPTKIKIESVDRLGSPVTIYAEGYRARACCHEIDHLDGIIYTDKIVPAPPEKKSAK